MSLLPPYPDPSRPAGAWSLATYNVQDLFDATDAPESHDEVVTENQLRNKLTRLGRVLHLLDADVIGLMEVETRGVLQRLNHEYLGDLGYTDAVLVEGNDPDRGIDVALLSRFPVVQIVSHAAETFTDDQGSTRRIFSRDCLECHVRLPSGETLVVLVNHLKSKRGGVDETAPLRLTQARRVREIADGLTAQFPLIAVVGDLNDTPDSSPLQALTQSGGLSDCVEDVPEAHRYSFVHAGQPERIDYVLASSALRRRLMPNSVFIPHNTWAKRASDHYPVRVTFTGENASYPVNLTVAYDAAHPPVRRGHVPVRINAARFYAHDLNPLQGQIVIVTGIVKRVEQTQGTGVVRLFLGHADPARAFRATVFPQDRAAFAQVGIHDIEGYYKGRMVQGVGSLGFYQGHPEIAIETPHQLRLITQE